MQITERWLTEQAEKFDREEATHLARANASNGAAQMCRHAIERLRLEEPNISVVKPDSTPGEE